MPVWAVKILVKLILGHIPFKHNLLRRIGIFKHGFMDESSYAIKIFNLHQFYAFEEQLPDNFIALELGPGDSLASALITHAYGAKASYHVDVGYYATQSIKKYKQIAIEFRENGLEDIANLENISSISEMLNLCNAKYLTNGLNSLKSIPSNSIDFVWSHSVLEHIRKIDFLPTMIELHRILKPKGKISHNVDLQDHLDKSLNNLRFPEPIWENNFFANSGFYTNRIRYSESLNIMRKTGFKILKQDFGTWKSLPIPRKKLHSEFRKFDDDELCIRTYSVLLSK